MGLPLHIDHPSTTSCYCCLNNDETTSPCCDGPTTPSSATSMTTTTTTMTTPDELCPRNEYNESIHINGLLYYKDFLSMQEQNELLDAIYNQPFEQIIARRQQFYGELYYHTSHKNTKLQPNNTNDTNHDENEGYSTEQQQQQQQQHQSLDLNIMKSLLEEKCAPFFHEESMAHHHHHHGYQHHHDMTGCSGFPSQVLVNEYRNNLGIASHFEDMNAFGSIILTISLRNPIYMTLKKPKLRTNACNDYHVIHKVWLEPGSLLIMKDEARYDYRHGISKYKWIHPPQQQSQPVPSPLKQTTKRQTNEQGRHSLSQEQKDVEKQRTSCVSPTSSTLSIPRNEDYRRVSITLRHLLPTRRQVPQTQDESKNKKDPSRY